MIHKKPSALSETKLGEVHSDIELLKLYGLDIICEKGRCNKYFVVSRDFEIAELKLLVDSVEASNCITYKKVES